MSVTRRPAQPIDLFHPDGKAPTPTASEAITVGAFTFRRFTAEEIARPPYRPVPGDRWGGWRLTDVRSLALDEGLRGRRIYEVDLDRVATSTDALDWLCQVGRKAWATHQIVGDLLRALECCVGPLQGLCHRDRMRGRGAT
jgi:hypothetical protein